MIRKQFFLCIYDTGLPAQSHLKKGIWGTILTKNRDFKDQFSFKIVSIICRRSPEGPQQRLPLHRDGRRGGGQVVDVAIHHGGRHAELHQDLVDVLVQCRDVKVPGKRKFLMFLIRETECISYFFLFKFYVVYVSRLPHL